MSHETIAFKESTQKIVSNETNLDDADQGAEALEFYIDARKKVAHRAVGEMVALHDDMQRDIDLLANPNTELTLVNGLLSVTSAAAELVVSSEPDMDAADDVEKDEEEALAKLRHE